MEKPQDKRILVRLPQEVAEKLEEVADQESRSINGQIVYLLKQALAGSQKREDKIRATGLVAA